MTEEIDISFLHDILKIFFKKNLEMVTSFSLADKLFIVSYLMLDGKSVERMSEEMKASNEEVSKAFLITSQFLGLNQDRIEKIMLSLLFDENKN